MITFEIVEMTNRWGQIADGMEQRAAELVATTLTNVHTLAVEAMRAPKAGRIYGRHVASQPGEPPAIDTGDLANSGRIDIDGLEGTLTWDSDHALHMELGAPRANVAARPFLEPAMAAERPAFDQGIKELITP